MRLLVALLVVCFLAGVSMAGQVPSCNYQCSSGQAGMSDPSKCCRQNGFDYGTCACPNYACALCSKDGDPQRRVNYDGTWIGRK